MQQQKQSFDLTDQKVIESNEHWFQWYVNLPMVTAIILGILFFVLAVIKEAAAIFIVGAIFAGIIYVLLKITLSYKVLHLYYLKKISLNTVSCILSKLKTFVLPNIERKQKR